MPKNIEKIVEESYAKLCKDLELFSYGKRFYSTRELMSLYGMSRRTVDIVLARLKENGHVTIEPTRGVFVARQGVRSLKKVVHFQYDSPCKYLSNLNSILEQTFKSYPGYSFESLILDSSTPFNYKSCQAMANSDVMLLTPPSRKTSASSLATFLHSKTPVMFLQNQVLCSGIDAIDLVPENSGMQAAHNLIANGHRKLGLIVDDPWSMNRERLSSGFINYAKLHNIEVSIVDYTSNSKFDIDFTGCFIINCYASIKFLEDLAKRGLSIPNDISAIAYGDVAKCAYPTTDLSSVDHGIHNIAQAIILGTQNLLAGKDMGIVSIPGTLIDRGSVKTIINKSANLLHNECAVSRNI